MLITDFRSKLSRNGNLNLIFDIDGKKHQCTANGYSKIPDAAEAIAIVSDDDDKPITDVFETKNGTKLNTCIFDGFKETTRKQLLTHAQKQGFKTLQV